jgi:hypothetical protein
MVAYLSERDFHEEPPLTLSNSCSRYDPTIVRICYIVVFISFSCNNKNVRTYPFTTDCNKLSATYSYIIGGIRMTRLIHVLCALY